MNAWLPKNLNLTQAKIFLRSKNISFGLGLNFWLVRQDMKYLLWNKNQSCLCNLLKNPGAPFSNQSAPGFFSSYQLLYKRNLVHVRIFSSIGKEILQNYSCQRNLLKNPGVPLANQSAPGMFSSYHLLYKRNLVCFRILICDLLV